MYLNVHSSYSLRYGTIDLDVLIEEACKLGISAMVLTDINNSSACMDFILKGRLAGIRPIVGIEFRNTNHLLYIGIARNKMGMKELNDFLTYHQLCGLVFPEQAPAFEHVYVIYPIQASSYTLNEHEFIGIRPEELGQLFRMNRIMQNKLVALHPVTFHGKMEYRLHHYLRAIDQNTLLTKVSEIAICRETESLRSLEELKILYRGYEYLLENAHQLLANCSTDDYEFGRRNKQIFTDSKANDAMLLERLTMEGMHRRYGIDHAQARKKIEAELAVIKAMDFCAYFLITWDVIHYSRSRGFYHVGRGSGANSTVAYCLDITDVDPIALDLYFERFLNSKRSSPPDFDIDYSWHQREEIQEYLLKRYGIEYTGLLGTISTFKGRSVIREVGKVLGLPKTEIDSFTDPTQDAVNRENPTFLKIKAVSELMDGMPNQRSIHAGGVLVSEEPITFYTALDLPPKAMPTVQWDMYAAEAIGLDKFDILSQRGIGHIKEAVELIRQNKGAIIDIHAVKSFLIDDQINHRLGSSDSIGCFYIESPAMRQLLQKLRCKDYLTLVAASSIIRPGVASSGMMRNYIYYFHHPDEVVYLHPVMQEQLKETYGVMVYQEDVIKVCYHYAGLDLADADVLRRAMSGKYRSRDAFQKLVDKFFLSAKAIGRDEAITEEVWRQISSFAGYSFSKAHSASFAIESYQSLYLKTYFPQEFMVAVLNNYGGFYARWLYVHELKKTGATIHLPCVNNSDEKVSIRASAVYLGLIGIQGLNEQFIRLIPRERKLNGSFRDLPDFIKRTGIGIEQLSILIKVGALRFTGRSKKELLWDSHLYLGGQVKLQKNRELFEVVNKQYTMPELPDECLEDAYQELDLLGYPVTLTTFDMLKTSYRGDVVAKDLLNHVGQTVKMVGLYVCEKTVHTKTQRKMWFGTFLDVDGNFFDTTHFPNRTPVYPFRGYGCYLLLGKVVVDFGVPTIEVEKFAKLPIRDNPIG
ncbi:DNA polymerase III subunit alpha [Olivibacter sp. CPCC 100613]|uniref:DNA polymerase III subunit alpha n=1 Tax=Olivibacter sp. CPCC 100613 TaxID=3079931 RepID=UPI002FF7ABF0